MLRHSPIFWVAISVSLITGIYGVITARGVVAIPYAFINPLVLFLITSWKKFEPIKRHLEVLGGLIVFLNIPGSVYLHGLGIQYDIVLHFFVSFVSLQAVYLILPLLLNNPKIPRTTAAIVTVVGGLAFEGIQKLSDLLFGTNLFFDVAQSSRMDFVIDVLTNILGTTVGVVYLKFTSSPQKPAPKWLDK